MRPNDEESGADPLIHHLATLAGADMKWRERGACSGIGEERSRCFTCIEPDTVTIQGLAFTGYAAQQVASELCFGCVVQWDCTVFALKTEQPIGVWGMMFRHLRWLRANVTDPVGLVEHAASEGTPVQVAVRHARELVATRIAV